MEFFTDVLNHLKDKDVIVYTLGTHVHGGKLINITASFIQLELGSVPSRSSYIPRNKIVAIAERGDSL